MVCCVVLLYCYSFLQQLGDAHCLLPLVQHLPPAHSGALWAHPVPVPLPILGTVQQSPQSDEFTVAPTGQFDSKPQLPPSPARSPVALSRVESSGAGDLLIAGNAATTATFVPASSPRGHSPNGSPSPGRRTRSKSVDSPSAHHHDVGFPTGDVAPKVTSPLGKSVSRQSSGDLLSSAATPQVTVTADVDAVHIPIPVMIDSMPMQAPPGYDDVPGGYTEDDDFIPVQGGGYGGGLIPPSPLVGSLLLRLLKFYGHDFNAETTGVSVRLGYWYTIDRMQQMIVDPVSIPDPVDEHNNVGRNCFRFQQIQSVMLQAYNAIVTASMNATAPLSYGSMLKLLFPRWIDTYCTVPATA